jgi:hypothetical protein
VLIKTKKGLYWSHEPVSVGGMIMGRSKLSREQETIRTLFERIITGEPKKAGDLSKKELEKLAGGLGEKIRQELKINEKQTREQLKLILAQILSRPGSLDFAKADPRHKMVKELLELMKDCLLLTVDEYNELNRKLMKKKVQEIVEQDKVFGKIPPMMR